MEICQNDIRMGSIKLSDLKVGEQTTLFMVLRGRLCAHAKFDNCSLPKATINVGLQVPVGQLSLKSIGLNIKVNIMKP